MKFERLSKEQKEKLESRHRQESDGRVRDRIKGVLLKNEGWSNKEIAQALRIHEETVSEHLKEWLTEEKLKPENGGSYSKLNEEETKRLNKHLSDITYTKVIDICRYVEEVFGVYYTVSGMTKWLKKNKFSYKKPKEVPAKADVLKQEEFIGKYLELVEKTEGNEPILFIDSAHPTMATKVVRGWIKRGEDKPIRQTASRTRVNIMGAIALVS